MVQDFSERIGFKGELKELAEKVCQEYRLGELKSCKLIEIGYEDFNFIIEADKKYFVKAFSSFRDIKRCQRYMDVMNAALSAGVSMPKLVDDRLHIIKIGNAEVRLCVMDFIDSPDLFTSKEKLNDEEIKFLARQAALINQINFKPDFEYDSWSIPNFEKELKASRHLVPEKYLRIIDSIKIPDFNKLPKAFVHGDILTTNVIKSDKLYITDFSVTNWVPRIQELAVMAVCILFNPESKADSKRMLRIALEEYQKVIPLTPNEVEVLPDYIMLGHAMHVICALKEEADEHFEENQFWIDLGMKGLELGRYESLN